MNGYTSWNLLTESKPRGVDDRNPDHLECPEVQREKLRIKKFFREAGAERESKDKKEVWLYEKQGSVMVASALISTVAFQAMMSPPGGFWQDSSNGHTAGEIIMAYNSPGAYYSFLSLNTLALMGSMTTVLLLASSLSPRSRFDLLPITVTVTLTAAVVCLAAAYAVSVTVVMPPEIKRRQNNVIKYAIILWAVVVAVGVYGPGGRKAAIWIRRKYTPVMTASAHTIPDRTPHGAV